MLLVATKEMHMTKGIQVSCLDEHNAFRVLSSIDAVTQNGLLNVRSQV